MTTKPKKSPKRKTARAIESNVGIRNKLQKKLTAFSRSFLSDVSSEIFKNLADSGMIAQDKSLSNPKTPEDKKLFNQIVKGVLAEWARSPEQARKNIDNFVERNLPKWTIDANNRARKLAIWVVRSIASDVTASQRLAYLAAGLPAEYIKSRWTDPVVKQRISQKAAEQMPWLIEWSTELITRMAVRDVNKLQQTISQSLEEGKSIYQIESVLRSMDGFNADRAKNVAIDQTNKITNGITRANDEELGITQGIWVHVPGQYSSRESHIKMNGQKFDLAVGCWDPKAQRHIQCGELPFCRCSYKPILPKF